MEYDYDTIKLKPYLAESYHMSDDGLEVTFKLRNDIYFSDDKPITTDDVIFTFNTIMDPQIDAASVAQQYTEVEKVIRLDDRQVRFIMKRPFFKTLKARSNSIVLFPPAPKL